VTYAQKLMYIGFELWSLATTSKNFIPLIITNKVTNIVPVIVLVFR